MSLPVNDTLLVFGDRIYIRKINKSLTIFLLALIILTKILLLPARLDLPKKKKVKTVKMN